MASSKNEQAFVKEIQKLQKDWPKLTQAEREKKLGDAINGPLKGAGAPPVKVVSKPLSDGRNGEFSFKTWSLDINQTSTKSPALSDDQAKKLAGTVFHEARHSEQWYLMARHQAAAGKDAAAISKELGIPKSVAEQAVKNPIGKKDPKSACATALYDSVYGKNRPHRQRTLTDLSSKPAAVKKAADEYKRLQSDPKASPKSKKEALAKWQKEYNDYQKTYKDYRNLAEEADAWNAGNAVEAAWPPAVSPPKSVLP